MINLNKKNKKIENISYVLIFYAKKFLGLNLLIEYCCKEQTKFFCVNQSESTLFFDSFCFKNPFKLIYQENPSMSYYSI